MEINLADFGNAEIPNEFEKARSVGNLTLIPRDLALQIVEDVVNPHHRGLSLYLTGPGGVGKSSILFIAASDSLRRNREAATATVTATSTEELMPIEQRFHVLMYIPNSENLAGISPEEASIEFCKMLIALNKHLLNQVPAFRSVLLDQSRTFLERWTKFCYLLRQSSFRSLILLDQWNSVLESAPNLDATHPLKRFIHLSDTIGDSKLVTAVSSSFLPVDSSAFRDNEATYNERKIDPLSWDEAQTLRDIWSQRSISVDNDLLLALFNETGGIPRLCEYFARTNPLAATIADVGWRQSCVDYYSGQIISFRNHITDDQIRNYFFFELASLFLLNRDPPSSASPAASRWQCSGLLVLTTEERSGFLVPVNVFVKLAMSRFVFCEKIQILKQLYRDSATRWRAIELFVALKFREREAHRTTLLNGTNPCGKNEITFEINENKINSVEISIEFARDPHAFLTKHRGGVPFSSGTILIPSWLNHGVSDMVLFVKLKGVSLPVLMFVQVSPSAYGDNRTKIPDLGRKLEGWKESVLNSYMLAFGLSFEVNTRNLEDGKLPARVRYVYATTSAKLIQLRGNCCGHEVILMREQHISSMDQVQWNEMVSE